MKFFLYKQVETNKVLASLSGSFGLAYKVSIYAMCWSTPKSVEIRQSTPLKNVENVQFYGILCVKQHTVKQLQFKNVYIVYKNAYIDAKIVYITVSISAFIALILLIIKITNIVLLYNCYANYKTTKFFATLCIIVNNKNYYRT